MKLRIVQKRVRPYAIYEVFQIMSILCRAENEFE